VPNHNPYWFPNGDGLGLGTGVLAISAGWLHACATIAGGAVKCWGYNENGQLGDGTTIGSSYLARQVSGLNDGIVKVAAGGYHTCAVDSIGRAKCWGANSSGQLGDGSTDDSSQPQLVLGLASDVVEISAGYSHSCAVTAAGTLMCWGLNEYGQLGNGSVDNSPVPVPVVGF